jgi:hypothetical protein
MSLKQTLVALVAMTAEVSVADIVVVALVSTTIAVVVITPHVVTLAK